MTQPRLIGAALWQRHERRVVTVLLRALELLEPESADEAENDLNRKLFRCLLYANREMHDSLGNALDSAPTYEGKNLPSAYDTERAVRENKIPDFYWDYVDHGAPNPLLGVRCYYIECKRLGRSVRSSWPLNENYVREGIARYVTEEHGYARDDVAAAMVGYVQNMAFDAILEAVNAAAVAASMPILIRPSSGWKQRGTSQIHQQLQRSFGVATLNLMHFWVDLRGRTRRRRRAKGAPSTSRPARSRRAPRSRHT
jgi:hypothetical protein